MNLHTTIGGEGSCVLVEGGRVLVGLGGGLNRADA